MDKINFPINFNAIGLDYRMTYSTFENSNKISYLRGRCQRARRDTIRENKSDLYGELHLQDGSKYEVVKTLASGSYGTTALIRNISSNQTYCLKRQIIQGKHADQDELDAFKEAMMHHILDLHTRAFEDYKSDLIPTLYHIVRFKVAKGPVIIYFIMDLMSSSLSNRISCISSEHDRLLEFVRCLTHITPTLRKLYKMGLYNHGDLHTDNVMYDINTKSYKLIDYGFSRIRIGSGSNQRILALSDQNTRSDESRDLTQLIVAFEKDNQIHEMEYTNDSFEHAVQQLIHRVVHSKCSGQGHDEHSYHFIDHSWKSSYVYFNTHTNMNGIHSVIQTSLNALPSPAIASEIAIRKPRITETVHAKPEKEMIPYQSRKQMDVYVLLLCMIVITTMMMSAISNVFCKSGSVY